MLDGVGGNAAAEAAAEAARRAAEEAARKAAQEAARKAAQEAARKAAEAAAKAHAQAAIRAKQEAQAKASQANVGRLDPKNFEMEKPDFERMGANKPAAQSIADASARRLADAVDNMADPRALAGSNATRDVASISGDDAKKEMADIAKGMKEAKSTADVQALQDRSQVLRGRMEASPGTDPALQKAADAQHDGLASANAALRTIGGVSQALNAHDPYQAANQTAGLLAGQPDLAKAIGDLAGFKGSPLLGKVGKAVQDIATKATPEHLSGMLQADPDLAHYPPGFAGRLASLEGSGDATLQDGLDAVGKNLLDQGLTADAANASPELLQLAVGAAQDDPATMAQLQNQVHAWVQNSLTAHMQNADHGSYQQALDAFKGDLADLAQQTGLGPMLADQATQVLNDPTNQAMMHDAAKRNEGVLDHLGDWAGAIGDFASGLAKDIGHIVGKGLDYAGDGLQMGMHYVGAAASTVSHYEGQALGSALKGVGLNNAGNFVERTADQVGEVQQDFADGMGDGFKGMATGIGFMAEHPGATLQAFGAMAKHPELIGKAAESMWNEASKGGYVHAAGYVTANIIPMLLTGGGAGAAEGAGEVATVAAAETTTPAAAEAATGAAGESAAEAAMDNATTAGRAMKAARSFAKDQVKDQFTDLREVAGNAKKLVGDAKELRGKLTGELKDAGRALRSGRLHEAMEVVHDNSAMKMVKSATGVLKDANSFVQDGVKLVHDPLSFVHGKLEGLIDSSEKTFLKPLGKSANTRMIRNEIVANINENLLPV